MTNKRKMSESDYNRDESLDELEFPVLDDTEFFEEVMEGMNENSPLEDTESSRKTDVSTDVESVENPEILSASQIGLSKDFPKPETLTAEELAIAKNLKGKPEKAPKSQTDTLNKLVELNIAANFGDEGYGRGYKWKASVK